MRAYALAFLMLVLAGCAAPAMAADNDRYSYITVEDIHIRLDNGTAVIHVNYTVDEGTRFIFFLLGKQDLKTKLLKILNYEDARIQRIDLSSADFTVYNASQSYGNGVYWYPSHEFNVVIPFLTVQSPQATKRFNNTKQFPGGMGFFTDMDVQGPGIKAESQTNAPVPPQQN
ncbi:MULTISPECIES: hypothetical protein [unclassified Methanoregula]|uniref:hypothetical protein n=1 Tax=unclassified Methanoregula TaxID=2649730 RepID=UPI0009D185B4|nr:MULTISPECIES: hypothetical protein [unclassified Methanoregula]OPX63892.1 MAG: hypothetical protein A4E33_01421 [Methanoregula sp. PtaB.Bin085]OPY35445.1 MAG: hypothetical protein A4E34_00719 [Methanoregula sp. PtaU1.Bin006]